MLSIDQDHAAALFQQVKHRPPINSGRFHSDHRNSQALQPIRKRQQTSRHRRGGPEMPLNFSIGQGRKNTAYDRVFLHIYEGTAIVDHWHTPTYKTHSTTYVWPSINASTEPRHTFST